MTASGILRNFRCLRCGACCRWPGYVRVTAGETEQAAAFLHLDIYDFTREYTLLLPDRTGLSLVEKPDGSCVFYDAGNRACRIEKVKPKQCRDFPFRWNFPGWDELCAGGRALKNENTTEEDKEI